MQRELELKFTTDGPLPDAAALRQALGPLDLQVGDPKKDWIKDRYFDDPRASLSRAGLALRRRMRDGQMLATLKTRGSVEGAAHDRHELELPLPDKGWPQEIEDRIAFITISSTLRPYTVLDSERTVFAVLSSEGGAVAELSFDLVVAKFQNGEAKVEFLEIELEAAEGTEEAELERIAEALETVMVLVPSPFTKLERAQALLMGTGL